MTKLIWDNVGGQYFEAGIDHGVLYLSSGTGVPWNGLTSVVESPSGGEATAYYIDGVKYLNVAALEEFAGTIKAFTYPDEFAEYDGSIELGVGLLVSEQPRKPFGLSYRTKLGNDVDGSDHGYKLHIVYNVLASPSEKTYSSLGESVDPLEFSWSFTTTAVNDALSNAILTPMSHVVIDSTKTDETIMQFIEDFLYGTSDLKPSLISLDQLFSLFELPTLVIVPVPLTGLNLLVDGVGGDVTTAENGLYTPAAKSRLTETAQPGLYTLEE